jgi:hypothetical protein
MLKSMGATLLILGLILSFTCWSTEKGGVFLAQIVLGPAMIVAGWQMLK